MDTEQPPQRPETSLLEQLWQQHEARHQAKEFLDVYVKIISLFYDKAALYTNVVLLGGYGAFFGLWGITRPLVTDNQARWAAILMVVSIATVVIFEVTKMVLTTNKLVGYWKTFENAESLADPALIRTRTQEFEVMSARYNAHFVGAWRFSLAIAVVTAISGVGILLAAFISGLF